METCDAISIAGVDPEIGTCQIVLPSDVRVGPVEGQTLEAAFERPGGGYLVLLGDDCPFEEGLSIYLLDRDGTITDRIHSRVAYTTGIFELLAVSEDEISFNLYSEDKVYRVKVGRPRWRWRLPRGWIYGGWQLRRSLSLATARA